MTLSYKEVAEILKIIDASSCDEVVLELGDTRLVVRRGGASNASGNLTTRTQSIAPAAEKQAASSPGKVAARDTVPGADAGGSVVKSPMAGTFYSRPSPGEEPFVEEGTKVGAGDTLCLIEVMKLYTTIEASADGVVESILADDGDLVEFDQPLFVIGSHDS